MRKSFIVLRPMEVEIAAINVRLSVLPCLIEAIAFLTTFISSFSAVLIIRWRAPIGSARYNFEILFLILLERRLQLYLSSKEPYLVLFIVFSTYQKTVHKFTRYVAIVKQRYYSFIEFLSSNMHITNIYELELHFSVLYVILQNINTRYTITPLCTHCDKNPSSLNPVLSTAPCISR